MNGHEDTLATGARAAALQVCSGCRQPFVVPRSIVEILDADRYLVELGCANCGRTVLAQHYDEELEALDFELQASADQIREAVELLTLVDELERIERFADALADDHILPEDF